MSEPTATDAPYNPEEFGESHNVIMTSSAILITLDDKLRKQARACLRKSGKITVSFKEISVTRLPVTLKDGVLID